MNVRRKTQHMTIHQLTRLHEDALVLRTTSRRHLKDNVLQASGLSSGPVDTSDGSGGRNTSHVNDKVANLSVEYVDCSPGSKSCSLIWVIFDHGKRTGRESKTAGGLE